MYHLSTEKENNTLILHISGRINSDNSPLLSKDILEGAVKDSTFSRLVIDFDGLEAISSAGLRIMLALKKKFPDFCIINASSAVYEVFDITGFSTIIDVRKAFRNLSVDGCEVIGEGAKGIVYRYNDDLIVKVYKADNSLEEIQQNSELSRKAFLMGIPTAISYDIVKVGDKYGAAYELVNSKSLSELIIAHSDKLEEYAHLFCTLLQDLEDVPVEEDDLPSIKPLIHSWVERTVPYLAEEEASKLRNLLDNTPDTLTVIHGDFHSNNIVIQNGEPLLLDLDTLACGNRIFELANIFFCYVGENFIIPEGSKAFLGIDSVTCERFYNLFIEEFFKNADDLQEIKDKIALVGYLRAANHTIKREKDKGKINTVINLLKEYLSKVNSIAL